MLQDGSPLFRPDHHPPSSTDCKEQEGLVEAEVIGVIRNIDINLSWLHPTKLYTCISVDNGGNKGEMDCSRYFQTLNLRLASNNHVLVSIIMFITSLCIYMLTDNKDESY